MRAGIPCRVAMAVLAGAMLMGQTAATTTAPGTRPFEEEEWGKTADGAVVKRFTLRNSSGMTVRVMSVGATMTELSVPDRAGKFSSVVLGADTYARQARFPFAAQIVGRVANRISNAKFTLDGKEYVLAANAGPHTIHGGRKGFGAVVWEGKRVETGPGEQAVEMTYVSKDAEEGFPGTMTAAVRYVLTDKNELRLEYRATADKATPVNLTSHAYFNLAGVSGQGAAVGNCLAHELWIDADRYTVADAQLIPTGEFAPVKGTPLDFTTATAIGARIDALKPMTTYDHNFVLNGGAKGMMVAARVSEPTTGRVMEVRTDQPGVQLYTGNGQHAAVCLETQHYPDSVHRPEFPSTILRPGETFASTTVYAFSVK